MEEKAWGLIGGLSHAVEATSFRCSIMKSVVHFESGASRAPTGAFSFEKAFFFQSTG